MNDDNRDDPNAGQTTRPTGTDMFDRDDPTAGSPPRNERRNPFFTDFEDDETAEIDDIEASDFGSDYDDDDSDYPGEDDTEELWDPSSNPVAASDTSTAGGSGESRFDDWPREHPEEDPTLPEAPDLWSTSLPAAGIRSDDKDDRDWDDDPDDEDDYQDDDEPLDSAEEDDSDDDSDQWDPAAEEDDLFDEETDDTDEDYDEEEDEPEDDSSAWNGDYGDDVVEEPLDEPQSIPWVLVAIGVLALVLLGAGGYGVMQQRADRDAEIRELRAQLATSVNPEEIASTRELQRELEQQNEALQMELDSLQLENRRLTDTVNGLESQLKGQQEAAAELRRSAEQAQQAAEAARSAPVASTSKGTWFVNFGSYGDRELAEQWASRLRDGNSKVIVAPAASNGRSLYRVRVIGLGSKTEAEGVARRLEQAHDLSKLWVGKE